jgi:VIT1/CCC1 family predicted Fe2+/Mn2+ transporter
MLLVPWKLCVFQPFAKTSQSREVKTDRFHQRKNHLGSGSDCERYIVALKTIERHRTGRIGGLRAAVLGANDGILSTSSLVLGVAASHAGHGSVVVAGAMSMASGEYVSVHSQADTEDGAGA